MSDNLRILAESSTARERGDTEAVYGFWAPEFHSHVTERVTPDRVGEDVRGEEVTIAWTAGGRQMARRAEAVHFAPGGRWSEGAVGTNGLALARLTGRPETVFSAEHFAPMVHDWVCYSALILDPHTVTFLAVIDVSTIWTQANPALLTTVSALARCVEYELATDCAPLADGSPPAHPPPGTVRGGPGSTWPCATPPSAGVTRTCCSSSAAGAPTTRACTRRRWLR